MSIALATAEEAVKLHHELVTLNRDAYPPNLAIAINNLAIDRRDAGHHIEAPAAAQEAIDRTRELALNEPNRFADALAAPLTPCLISSQNKTPDGV